MNTAKCSQAITFTNAQRNNDKHIHTGVQIEWTKERETERKKKRKRLHVRQMEIERESERSLTEINK